MADIFLDADNAITHQLLYTPSGSNKQREYNLSTATEVKVEFYQDKKLVRSFSSLNHTGVQIVNAIKGIVSYQPDTSDFDGIFDINRVNFVRWRVVNPLSPNGLVFGRPSLPVRIFR